MTDKIHAYDRHDVKDHRVMETDVDIFRNGLIVMTTVSTSNKKWEGLTGHSMFAVIADDKGNAIWATTVYKMKTVCGTMDVCSHRVTDVDQEQAPDAIGKYASSIYIYHDSGDLSQSRQAQVDSIKKAVHDATDIAKEVKDAVDQLY